MNEDKITIGLIDNLFTLSPATSAEQEVNEWLAHNGAALINLSISEFKNMLEAGIEKKDLMAIYKEKINALSWQESLDLLMSGIDALKKHNDSAELQRAYIAQKLLTLAPQAIVLLLSFL